VADRIEKLTIKMISGLGINKEIKIMLGRRK